MESEHPRLKLVVGLGNPGARYARTRHNAGRWWTSAVAQSRAAPFAAKMRWRGQVAECDGARLFHPDSFMNESGAAAARAAQFCAAQPQEILVAHDEVDLPPGTVKLKFGGGEAGHNGLRDISNRIGKQYWRLRIGVGKPNSGAQEVPDHVLQKPNPQERQLIDDAIARALQVWPEMVRGDFNRAALILHTIPKPVPQGEPT